MDDDTFATASDTTLATSESIKAYVDSNAGDASLTGIDDNATEVAITIDSSERVGINATSPKYSVDTSKAIYSGISTYTAANYGDIPGYLYLNGTSDTGIVGVNNNTQKYLLQSGSNTISLICYDNTGFKTQAYDASLEVGNTQGLIQFKTGSAFTERARITDNGLAIGNTATNPTPVNGTTAVHATASAGAEFIAGTNDSVISGGAFMGGYIFRNADLNGSPPHYAGMWAESADAVGNMNLYFAAGSTKYETGNSDLTIASDGTITASGDVIVNKLNISNIPTSASGLSSGDVYNDSGTLKIVT